MWPNLRPIDVARMAWHERWFYLDWISDDIAESSSTHDPLDPSRSWAGSDLPPDVAAALGANVRTI